MASDSAKPDESVTVHISTLYPRPDLEFPERRVLLHPQRDTLLIGRQSRTRPDRAPEPDNGLFNSPVMSREHAKITADLSAKKLFLSDAGSLHGTFLNGEKITKDGIRLRDGDIVKFGIDIMNGNTNFPPLAVEISHCFEQRQPRLNSTPPIIYAVPDDSDEGESTDSDVESVHEFQKRPIFKPAAADIVDLTMELPGEGPDSHRGPSSTENQASSLTAVQAKILTAAAALQSGIPHAGGETAEFLASSQTSFGASPALIEASQVYGAEAHSSFWTDSEASMLEGDVEDEDPIDSEDEDIQLSMSEGDEPSDMDLGESEAETNSNPWHSSDGEGEDVDYEDNDFEEEFDGASSEFSEPSAANEETREDGGHQPAKQPTPTPGARQLSIGYVVNGSIPPTPRKVSSIQSLLGPMAVDDAPKPVQRLDPPPILPSIQHPSAQTPADVIFFPPLGANETIPSTAPEPSNFKPLNKFGMTTPPSVPTAPFEEPKRATPPPAPTASELTLTKTPWTESGEKFLNSPPLAWDDHLALSSDIEEVEEDLNMTSAYEFERSKLARAERAASLRIEPEEMPAAVTGKLKRKAIDISELVPEEAELEASSAPGMTSDAGQDPQTQSPKTALGYSEVAVIEETPVSPRVTEKSAAETRPAKRLRAVAQAAAYAALGGAATGVALLGALIATAPSFG